MSSTQEPPPTQSESEPLLGRPGDALQPPNAPMLKNLVLGTGWLALLGLALLLSLILSAVATHPIIPLVTPHPVLQTLGLTSLTLAILILQPTGADPTQKALGAKLHAGLNFLSLILFTAGVAVIETNKNKNGYPHFHSAHAYFGVLTGVGYIGQYAFGVAMYAFPAVFGGEDKAKAVWKYHRYSGYGLFVLLLATVVSAAETDYAAKVLGIKTWAVVVGVLLVAAGVYPRIQLRKLGIQRT